MPGTYVTTGALVPAPSGSSVRELAGVRRTAGRERG